MIGIARNKSANEDFEIKGNIYAFDSSTIDICLSVFWWAKFRKAKGGIKIHTLFDITTQIPAFIHITSASVNDMNAMDYITCEEVPTISLTVATLTFPGYIPLSKEKLTLSYGLNQA